MSPEQIQGQTIDRRNLCTAIVGRGKGIEIAGADTDDPAYGRRLEFTDVVWTVAGGDPADKPAGQNYLEDTTATAAYGPAGRRITQVVEFNDITDAEVLLQATYDELQIRKVPLTTYEMSVITLEELSGHAHEAVRNGDTVAVINTSVIPAITGLARVIKLDRNLIDPRDCTVTLGNYIPSLVDSMAIVQTQQASMLSRSGVWDRSTAIELNTTAGGEIQYMIDLLKTQLAATTSGFYTDANGNYIWENTAQTKALKLGAGIFALANSKTGGEYDWRTFGTGDGMTADEILAGTLRAGIIFAGTLSAASGTFVDLIAGIATAQRMHLGYDEFGDPFQRIYDDAGELQLELGKTGIDFLNGAKFTKWTTGTRTGVAVFT
jgi:hypothetical protein